MQKSVEIVNGLLNDEIKMLKGDSEKVFLGGFSQGCCLSLAAFMQYNKKLGGIVGLSGMMGLKLDWNTVDLELKRKTPIFLYHGEIDPMIGCHDATMSYQPFKTHNLDYTFTTEKYLEHSLSMEEIIKTKEFFSKHMK